MRRTIRRSRRARFFVIEVSSQMDPEWRSEELDDQAQLQFLRTAALLRAAGLRPRRMISIVSPDRLTTSARIKALPPDQISDHLARVRRELRDGEGIQLMISKK